MADPALSFLDTESSTHTHTHHTAAPVPAFRLSASVCLDMLPPLCVCLLFPALIFSSGLFIHALNVIPSRRFCHTKECKHCPQQHQPASEPTNQQPAHTHTTSARHQRTSCSSIHSQPFPFYPFYKSVLLSTSKARRQSFSCSGADRPKITCNTIMAHVERHVRPRHSECRLMFHGRRTDESNQSKIAKPTWSIDQASARPAGAPIS